MRRSGRLDIQRNGWQLTSKTNESIIEKSNIFTYHLLNSNKRLMKIVEYIGKFAGKEEDKSN